MFEHRSAPLLPRHLFLKRVLRHGGYAFAIVVASLVVGTAGFHLLALQSWIDALLNAAMLLGGMGPIGDMKSDGGKLFAAAFALYAGLVFLVAGGVFLAPFVHRILHRFHLEEEDPDADGA